MEEERVKLLASLKAKVKIEPISSDNDPHVEGNILTTEELDDRKRQLLRKANQVYKKPLKEIITYKSGKQKEVTLIYNTKKPEPSSASVTKYKTALCKHYPCCPYGENCQYAHGEAELAHFRNAQPCLEEYYQKAKKAKLEHAELCRNQQCPVRLRLLLRKTVMCKYWKEEKCRRSLQSCDWAHGEKDLRALPKREMCQRYHQGKCNLKNTECVYAHDKKELRDGHGQPVKQFETNEENEFSDGSSAGDDSDSDDSGIPNVQRRSRGHYHRGRVCRKQNCYITRKTLLRKTQMCWHWEAGRCTRGKDRCSFAHGVDDLQPLPKYELCEMYLEGMCYWSSSQCVFAHSLSELRSPGDKTNCVFATTNRKPSHLQTSNNIFAVLQVEEDNASTSSESFDASENSSDKEEDDYFGDGEDDEGDCEEDPEAANLCRGCRNLQESLPAELRPRYFYISRKKF